MVPKLEPHEVAEFSGTDDMEEMFGVLRRELDVEVAKEKRRKGNRNKNRNRNRRLKKKAEAGRGGGLEVGVGMLKEWMMMGKGWIDEI